MKNAIYRRSKARQDLVDIFRYYAREAGLRLARRFVTQAEATFTKLAGMPGGSTERGAANAAKADSMSMGLEIFPDFPERPNSSCSMVTTMASRSALRAEALALAAAAATSGTKVNAIEA